MKKEILKEHKEYFFSLEEAKENIKKISSDWNVPAEEIKILKYEGYDAGGPLYDLYLLCEDGSWEMILDMEGAASPYPPMADMFRLAIIA